MHLRSIFSVVLSALFFFTNVAALHSAENNLWEERRHLAHRPNDSSLIVAGLPSGFQIPSMQDDIMGPTMEPHLPDNLPRGFAQQHKPLLKSLFAHGIISRISLPSDSASKFTAPTVVLVQDLHGQFEAQQNLGEILVSLVKTNKKLLVGLEAATGAFKIDPYRRLSPATITQRVAAALLQDGRMGGAEYAAMTSPTPLELWGIEDPILYTANVASAKEALRLKSSALLWWDEMLKHYTTLETRLGADSLRTLRLRREEYASGTLSLAHYVESLTNTKANLDHLPNIDRFSKVLRLEKTIDFAALNKERGEIIGTFLSSMTPIERDVLLAYSMGVRDGSVTHTDFFGYLKQCLGRRPEAAGKFPQIERYVTYVSLSERISREAFLTELLELEIDAANRTASTSSQAKLVKIDRALVLLHKLLDLKMTPMDWQEYSPGVGENLVDLMKELDSSISPHVPPPNFAPFEDFCRFAIERNSAMVTRFLEKMRSTKARTAVLVAGGFHSEGLLKEFGGRGVGVLVVTPKIKGTLDSANYLDVFSRDPLPIDRMFAGQPISLLAERCTAERVGDTTGAAVLEATTLGLHAGERLREIVSDSTLPEKEKAAQVAKAVGEYEERAADFTHLPGWRMDPALTFQINVGGNSVRYGLARSTNRQAPDLQRRFEKKGLFVHAFPVPGTNQVYLMYGLKGWNRWAQIKQRWRIVQRSASSGFKVEPLKPSLRATVRSRWVKFLDWIKSHTRPSSGLGRIIRQMLAFHQIGQSRHPLTGWAPTSAVLAGPPHQLHHFIAAQTVGLVSRYVGSWDVRGNGKRIVVSRHETDIEWGKNIGDEAVPLETAVAKAAREHTFSGELRVVVAEGYGPLGTLDATNNMLFVDEKLLESPDLLSIALDHEFYHWANPSAPEADVVRRSQTKFAGLTQTQRTVLLTHIENRFGAEAKSIFNGDFTPEQAAAHMEEVLHRNDSMGQVEQRVRYFQNRQGHTHVVIDNEVEFVLSNFRQPKDSSHFNRIWKWTEEGLNLIREMARARSLGEHVLLVGEAGVGKDWLALAYGELMGEDPIVMSLSKETEGTDLREWRGLKDGETHWVSSQLLKAYEEGKIIILDEITKSRPGARAALNDLVQTERIQLADGRWVKRGEGFQIIGTMNEAKEGYGGRELDEDLEDRFGAILHVKDLPKERRVAFLKRVSEAGNRTPLPEQLLKSLVDLQEKVNEEAGKNNIRRMSLRVLERVVEHVTTFPEGGVEGALRTEFPLEKGKEILDKAIARADLAIRVDNPLENIPVNDVREIQVSPNGRSIAVRSKTRIVVYMNGQWGEVKTDLGEVYNIAWSPDGSKLATSSLWGVALYENGQWVKVKPNLGGGTNVIAWSPDGRKLAAGDLNGVAIYANDEWVKVKTDLGEVSDIAWSPEGNKLAAVGQKGISMNENDEWGEVWTDLREVSEIAWSPDGMKLAAIDKMSLAIYENGQWGEVKTDLGKVWNIAWSPDGRKLAADGHNGVEVYENDTWGEMKTDLGEVWNITWSPDGRKLAAYGQNGVAIYENDAWGEVKTDLGVVKNIAWSPDGNQLAAEGNKGIAIYENGPAWGSHPGYSLPFWYQNKWMGVHERKIVPITKEEAPDVLSRARQATRVNVDAPRVENGELVSGPVRLPVGEEVGVPGPEYEYAGKSNAHNNRIVHEILKGIALKRNVLLVGPVGVGKSWLAMAVFRLLGQRVEHMGLHAGTTTTDLVAIRKSESRGGKLSTSYELSRLAVAMMEGRPIIIDEVNRADMGVVTKLNHLLQYGELVLSEPIEVEIDGKKQVIERIRAKEGFQIVMTMNPAGGKVSTANELTNDFIDRMYVVEVGYMPKDQEKAWLEKVWGGPNEDVQKEIAQMVEIAEASRARAAKGEGRAISTRVLERMVRYKKANPETGWMELLTMMSGVEGATQEVVWKHARIAWEAKFGAETPRGPPVVKMSTNKEEVTLGQRTWRRKDPGIASRYFNFEGIPENDRVIELMGKMRAMGEHVLLVGEAGVGKDWLALAYGELMGEDPIVMSLSKETEGTDLREWRGLKDGETHWVSSQLLKAYEEGKIIILDEFTKSRPGARAALNDLMQTERIQLADGRWVRRGEGFQIIGTMNEAKEGYGGRELDEDLEDRFGAILHVKDLSPKRRVAFLKRVSEAGKDTPLPAELLQSLVELQEKVNKEAGKNNIRRMSLRVLERVVEHVTKFPEGGVESALRTEFPLEKGKEILEKAIAEADLAIGMRISFLENVPEGVGRVKVSKMSGDGKSVAAIGENGVAIYANGQWGEAQTDLRRGGAVAWSPDGSQLAAGGTNGVAVWANGGWGKVRTKLGWVQDIVWSPNGRKLVAKGDIGVEIYENGQWGKAETDLGLVWSVAWSSDGSKLAVGGTGGVAIYANDQWGDVMTELGKVKKVAWNLDGSQLSAGGIWGVRIRASGRWGEVKTDLGEVWRFSQRPGGTQLVAGGQKGVAIYEDDQWGEVKTDLGSVWNIAWRPDGSQLVAGGQNGVAIYENGQWGKVKMDLGKVSMVVWNSDGSKLVAEIENGVAIYANGVWAEVLRDFGGVWTVAWSPDGKRVAAEGTNGVAIYANGRAWEIYPGYSCPFWYQNKWMGVLDGKIAPIEKDQATGVFSRARQEARVAVEAPTVENGELVSGPVRLPVGEEVGVPGPEYEYAGKSNAHNNGIVHAILKGIALKRNVLLVGPVGVGKSWLAMAVFRLLGQRVEHMGLHAGTTTTDLVAIRKSESRGGKLSTSYELSRLAVAMLKGRPVIIDEVNRADMGVVTKLNHLLQYGELVLSEPIEVEIDGQNQVIERIRAKEGFQIVMTMNPAGGKVTTANELTNDFIDRMYVVDVGYMPKGQEKAWLEKVWGGPNEDVQKEIAQMVEIAEASRGRAAKGEGRAISTRVLERMVRYKRANPETGWMELLTMMSGVEGATQEVVWKHARIAWEAKFGAETPRGPPVVKMSTNKEAVTIGQRTWRRKDPEIASRYFNFEGIPENDRVIELMGKMRAMGEHVLLVGEAGVGKDWLALAYGELMGEDPIVMSLSKETEGTDLREWRGLKDGETHWVSSQLLKAYEEGKIIILDEITKSRPGARAALNDLMQTERIQLADGRWVKRGEGFQIIGTMNEAKEGFGGRELDDDLEDRFGAILHVKDLPAERRVAFLKRVSEAGKDTPLPESLLESLVELQEKVKEEAGKNNIRRMSLRVLERVVEHVTKFPEGGVEGALRTEFPLEKGKEILEKAIANADLAIRVGNPLETIPEGASLVGGINVSPNGRSVVVYGNNGIVVYANGQWGEVETDVVGVLDIAWSSDGDQLAAMGKHGLAVYANGQWSNVKTDLGEVRGIAWNPDGRKLAGYGENGVAVYENGQWGKVKSHMGEVWNIAWSLDGSQLAAGGGGVAVYKNGQWSEVDWGFGGVRDIVWSPDGSQLAARGQNGVAVNKNGKWGTMMTDLGSPLGFAWSPDGRKLAAGGEFGMAIYEDDQWSEVRTDLGEVVKFVWSPDGRKLAAIAQKILNSVVIIENGQLGEMKSGVREVWAIAWSPDGSQLAVGGRNGVAVNKNGKWGSMNTDFGWSLGVDWSPDWSKLVSRGEKGVAMYENEKWSEVRTDLGEVMKVVWNPDGSQMAAIGSKGVAIYSNGGNWETYPDYSLPFWYQNKWMGVHDRKVVPITKEEAPDVLSRARQATRVNVEAPRVENGELVSGTVRLPVGKEEGAPGPEFAYASKSNAHNNGIVHAILKGIALKRNVLLVGPVGVGKSWLAMAVFRLLGQRVEHMGLHAGTTTTDLVAIRKSESRGGKLSTSYELSRLAVAMLKGRPVIIDEVNRADMGVVTKLNHLLQYGELVLSEPIEVEIDGKKQVIERIRAKEGFQIVMTMNPAGGKVSTANELTNDFIDRMYVVDVGYMPENQEAEWLKMVAGDPSVSSDIAVLTREAARMRATEGKSPSPRSLERVIRSLRRYPNQDPSSLVTREWGLAMRPDEAKAVKTTLVAEAFGETIKHNWKTAFVAPVQRFGALVSTALNLVVQANTPDSSYDPKSWWTSGNPGWIQQQRARERQRVLKEVVRIVTGMDLPFEPWYPIRESELGRIKTWRMVWNSKTFVPREMNFVAEDLIQAGNDNSVLGVTYHELFEFLFRHPEASSPEFLAKPGAAVLDNGVGDIWINEIGMKAFRGSRPWIDAFYIEKFGTRLDPVAGVVSMAQQPLYFQFTLGVIHEWAFGRRDPSIVNPNVLEALETLCEEVRKVFEAGDVPSHKSKMQELYDTPAFQKIVEMSVKDKAQKDAASDGTLGDDVEFGDGSSGGERILWETMSEEQRQALQKKIQEKWDSLSPEQKRKLLDKAAKDLAKRDRSVSPSDQPTLVDEKGDPLSPDQIQKVQEKIRRNIEQARKENEQYEKDQEEARLRAEEERALRDAEERKREGLTETAQADYNQRYERVRGDVHHMRRVFRLFFQQQEDYWQRWLEKGVLDDDALPLLLTGETRVYKKRTEPDKFSVRLSLLIDQSGSMDGDKISAVADTVLMMLEAIKEDQKKGIALEIVGFHDEFPAEIYFPYGAKLDKAKIVEVIAAVNKTYGDNSDMRAVVMALRRIPVVPNELNLVIHMGDGDPNFQFNRDRFRALLSKRPHVSVVGLGIGPGAQLVLDLFPPGEGVWAERSRDVPARLSEVLTRFVGRHGRNGRQRTERLSREGLAQSQNRQHPQVFQKAEGGVLGFLKSKMTLAHYARQAWWRETVVLTLLGSAVAVLWIMAQVVFPGLPAVNLSGLVDGLWAVFVGAHIVDVLLNVFRPLSEKSSPKNIFYAALIALVNAPLALLPIPAAVLVPVLVVNAFFSHYLINVLARSWESSRMDHLSSTVRPLLLPAFSPVLPLETAIQARTFSESSTVSTHRVDQGAVDPGIVDREIWRAVQTLLDETEFSAENPLGVNLTELFVPNMDPVKTQVLATFLRSLAHKARQESVRGSSIILLVRDRQVSRDVIEQKMRSLAPGLLPHATILRSGDDNASGVFVEGEDLTIKISPRGLANHCRSTHVQLAVLDQRDIINDLSGTLLLNLGAIVETVKDLIQQLKITLLITQHA